MTTPPTTQARAWIAHELAQLGVPVFVEPPETVAGVCIVLVPGEPWAARKGLAGVWTVVIDVTVLIPMQGGRTMLPRLEAVAHQVAMLPQLRRPPGVADLPTAVTQRWGQTDYLAATIPTQVTVNTQQQQQQEDSK